MYILSTELIKHEVWQTSLNTTTRIIIVYPRNWWFQLLTYRKNPHSYWTIFTILRLLFNRWLSSFLFNFQKNITFNFKTKDRFQNNHCILGLTLAFWLLFVDKGIFRNSNMMHNQYLSHCLSLRLKMYRNYWYIDLHSQTLWICANPHGSLI